MQCSIDVFEKRFQTELQCNLQNYRCQFHIIIRYINIVTVNYALCVFDLVLIFENTMLKITTEPLFSKTYNSCM